MSFRFRPQLNATRRVHFKQTDRGTPSRRETHNRSGSRPEMLVPTVAARMEKRHDIPGLWVDGGKIRPLEEIAPVARQRKVFGVVATPVLSGDNVLDVKCGLKR